MGAGAVVQEGERWDGEFEAAAREARLRRQRNLARGWHVNGWRDPEQLVRQLDDQADPVELRALARMRETERQRDDGRTTASEALRWLRDHPTRNV
jgi:hypothetical protein